MRTGDEQPAPPFFPDQILRKSVGQHGAGRRGMNHVDAAILFAQSIVGRAVVEKQEIAASIRRLEQRIGRKVRDHGGHAALRKRRDRSSRIVNLLQPHLFQRNRPLQKAAGGVVGGNRERGGGDSVVGGRYIQERNRGLGFRRTQEPDLDLDRVGGKGL